jgi:hypothetical protein
MIFDQEFKDAICALPSKEKDKLLLRLIKKDKVLCKRLYFDLIECGNTEEKRNEVKYEIVSHSKVSERYGYKPGYLLMDIREMSGMVNEHVSVTKDKFGEISLTLVLLIESLNTYGKFIGLTRYRDVRKLLLYLTSKVFKIVLLIDKMHEDLKIEFQEDLTKLGELLLTNNHLSRSAKQNGLDLNWLIESEIPDNIQEIYREIRKQGYLSNYVYEDTPDFEWGSQRPLMRFSY